MSTTMAPVVSMTAINNPSTEDETSSPTEKPADSLLPGRRRRARCCTPSCFVRALVSGCFGAAGFFCAALALDDTLMWKKDGATKVGPFVFFAAILAPMVLSEVACSAFQRRRWPAARPHTKLGAIGQYLSAFAMFLVVFFSSIWLSRATSSANLDDVNPSGCLFLPQYKERSNAKYLWIIPVHDGVNISTNASWCAEMLRLQDKEGFVLGMHGVHHEPHPDGRREFEGLTVAQARTLLDDGVAVWRAAFGAAPRHFSFPGEWASHEIAELVRNEYGMRVRTLMDGLLHRIYHCDDSFCGDGAFMCRDWAVDIF